MGYICNHAIIVSSEMAAPLERAYLIGVRLFTWPISPITPLALNGRRSFFVPPDGSKEGWPESDQGNELRNKFVEELKAFVYEDGSSPLDWVEVQFGDDYGVAKICNASDWPIKPKK
jgi:hypothetical protein